jgi:formylmethanofuran dehydrogenase subunit E
MSPSVSIHARSFEDLLAEAVSFHGHLCPGQVLGVRMTLAGCREVGVEDPRAAGKSLAVIVEIDRCATDAIQALTGVSLGKRTLKHYDFGTMAATFVNVAQGRSVRVAARESARDLAARLVPAERDPRRAQIAAYRWMDERDLLAVAPVIVTSEWLGRRRVRVACSACGEGINYEREVRRAGAVLCRACAGERYYDYDRAHTGRSGTDATMDLATRRR